jgi:hypothetical protein
MQDGGNRSASRALPEVRKSLAPRLSNAPIDDFGGLRPGPGDVEDQVSLARVFYFQCIGEAVGREIPQALRRDHDTSLLGSLPAFSGVSTPGYRQSGIGYGGFQ